MKRPFSATVWKEGDWYVSQCLEIDIASQGETEEKALANLKEALELYFEAPQATRPPKIRTIEARRMGVASFSQIEMAIPSGYRILAEVLR